MGWNSDLTIAARSVRDRAKNSASSSQVWHRDDSPFPSIERSEREMNHFERNLQTDVCGPGERLTKRQATSTLERNGNECQAEGEAEMGN